MLSGFDICQYRQVSNPLLSLTDVSDCVPSPPVGAALSAETAAQLAVRLKAIADPVRLRLLTQIAAHAGGQACVCDISDGFDVSQPTISHHLKVLRQAGLLDSERRGSWVYYWVLPAAFAELSALLTGIADSAATPAR